MERLAESRRFELRFNMPHPDTTQYNLLRVREVYPDTTRLPSTTSKRSGLDTIVSADSLVFLTLRPGGGALLELTHVPADSSFLGALAYNNGHRVVFDGQRYHATYVRYNGNDSSSATDTVFYRYSYPIITPAGGVRWLGFETPISKGLPTWGDTSRIQNRNPVLTVRRVPQNPYAQSSPDTYVSIAWTCHAVDATMAAANIREVVMVNLKFYDFQNGDGSNGYLPLPGAIQLVEYHFGHHRAPWGTPAISNVNGGTVVAWSDSVYGIQARLRLWNNSWQQRNTAAWTPTLQVTGTIPCTNPKVAMFPTMPTSWRVNSTDSATGIAWQQWDNCNGRNIIIYRRLRQTGTGGLLLAQSGYKKISEGGTSFLHPSLDLLQSYDTTFQEGLAWEERSGTHSKLYYRTIQVLQDTGSTLGVMRSLSVADSSAGNVWPSIGALNDAADSAHQNDTAWYAIGYVDSGVDAGIGRHRLMHLHFRSDTIIKPGFPKIYSFNGYSPIISTSRTRQTARAMTLHEESNGAAGGSRIRTSRQFFARSRPSGYVADGRRAVLRLGDTIAGSIRADMEDVWFARDTVGEAIGMVPRDSVGHAGNSMADVAALLQTQSFTTYDSVTIGCRVSGAYLGDSSLLGDGRAMCRLELIDSASDDVVALLDSFEVSVGTDYVCEVLRDLDLVSGTYSVRLSIDTAGVQLTSNAEADPVTIVETARSVDDLNAFGKARRRSSRPQAALRLSASPNPAANAAELQFTLPKDAYVTISLYDHAGALRTEVLQRQRLNEGRYAVLCDLSAVPAGTYLVRLQSSVGSVTEQVVVIR